jgi:hypothetical protein
VLIRLRFVPMLRRLLPAHAWMVAWRQPMAGLGMTGAAQRCHDACQPCTWRASTSWGGDRPGPALASAAPAAEHALAALIRLLLLLLLLLRAAAGRGMRRGSMPVGVRMHAAVHRGLLLLLLACL